MEIDVPTTEPVVLESGVENTLIPSEEGDFLITITSDRGVPVVKLTGDEKTLAEGSSLVNREFKAHLKAAGDLTVTESLSGTVLTLEVRAATPLAVQAIPVAMGVKHLVSIPTNQPEVLYFGIDVENSVQSVLVNDGDIIIPASDTAHIPVNRGITLTPLIHQAKTVATLNE